MTTVRTGKSKGSAFEADARYNLSKVYPDIIRLGCEGFCAQYDLMSKEHKLAFECKRLKGISWNECVKFYEKLRKVAPVGYTCYLLFKSNLQPALVFFDLNQNSSHDGEQHDYRIADFERYFEVEWEKHPSTRVKKE